MYIYKVGNLTFDSKQFCFYHTDGQSTVCLALHLHLARDGAACDEERI
jgi:hypothetical protein